MKLETNIFYSRISRRIFALFVLCALMPITILAAVSFQQVTSGLEEQYKGQMRQMNKSVAVAIYDRLLLLDTNINAIATDFKSKGLYPIPDGSGQESLFSQWFTGIVFLSASLDKSSIYKDIEDVQDIMREGDITKSAGKTILRWYPAERGMTRLFIVRPVDEGNIINGVIVAEVNTLYLWGIGPFRTIPQQTRISVIDQFRNIYLTPFKNTSDLLGGLAKNELLNAQKNNFYFQENGTEYLASYQSVFMRSRFEAPNWIVILSQRKSEALEPLTYFKQVFPLVILLSVWIVMLLSIYYIRKSLVPLEKLKEGTDRLIHGDFTTKVEVDTEDEFSDLAVSFNAMSKVLNKQLNTQLTRAEIDRVILSSLDTDTIIRTMLTRISTYLDCEAMTIGIVGNIKQGKIDYYKENVEDGPLIKNATQVQIEPDQLNTLFSEHYVLINKEDPWPSYIPKSEGSAESFAVVPAIVNEKLVALIIVGYRGGFVEEIRDDFILLSQLAGQMAIALENSRLIDDLEKLSRGAIEAFGRAVDAKSSWTAGHSERVTNYAIQIGQAMDIPKERLEILVRAALLHDIGKIGIPVKILDKPSALSGEEYNLIKQHPQMGGQMLEPITKFGEVVPIILQHHENHDGSGYPEGLKADEILFEARILRVADVFDALVSIRPYRKEWDRERIVAHLKDEAGKKFDEEIVEVFLKLLADDAINVNPLLLF